MEIVVIYIRKISIKISKKKIFEHSENCFRSLENSLSFILICLLRAYKVCNALGGAGERSRHSVWSLAFGRR